MNIYFRSWSKSLWINLDWTLKLKLNFGMLLIYCCTVAIQYFWIVLYGCRARACLVGHAASWAKARQGLEGGGGSSTPEIHATGGPDLSGAWCRVRFAVSRGGNTRENEEEWTENEKVSLGLNIYLYKRIKVAKRKEARTEQRTGRESVQERGGSWRKFSSLRILRFYSFYRLNRNNTAPERTRAECISGQGVVKLIWWVVLIECSGSLQLPHTVSTNGRWKKNSCNKM